jgi:hypothetical protein
VFALDETAWPRPEAKTLEGRGFVHSATPSVDGAGIVVGHSYSMLAWVEESRSSWALPVSSRRVAVDQTATEVGVAQVKRLCKERSGSGGALDVIVADGQYGNHRFLGPLKTKPCGVLARMRCDRVLYGEPGPYSGRGRPRVHGARFGFKEPETWPEPAQHVRLEEERFGEVDLRLWEGLHAKQDAETTFSVVRAQTHCQKDGRAAKPLWLAWQEPFEASASAGKRLMAGRPALALLTEAPVD